MSEPGGAIEKGIPESPAQQFNRRLKYQTDNNEQMFGLNPKGVILLYGKQTEDLKSALKIGDTNKIVENAPFRFVAKVDGRLEDFALVVNATDRIHEGHKGELLIVAASPNLNIKGDNKGEVKLILEPQVYLVVQKQVYSQKLDIPLRRLVTPSNWLDEFRSKLKI